MKPIERFFTGLGMLTLAFSLHAQLAVQSIGEAQPDSIVQLAAEAQGLVRIAPVDLPVGGTYWLAGPGGSVLAPMPCPPADTRLPIFKIAEGQFLVDGSGSPTGLQSASAVLEAQATAVVNLIDRVQETQFSKQFAAAFGMEEELSQEGTNTPMFAVTDPDGLWLEITNVANGFAYMNLHNATNESGVYAVWSATNLATPFANWRMETEVWPTDTNCQPFTVSTSGRDSRFLRAQDWTGVELNGLPCWWTWFYFGNLDKTAAELDVQGNPLGDDYTNNVPPAVFSFTGLEVTNNYVVSSSPVMQLDVAGSPFYIAILVDDDNFSNAVWNVYSGSTVSVNLGLTEGWHEVWIGLRGHADAADAAAWQWRRLKLDFTPPALVITGPTNGTVDLPIIQLTGYSPEALSHLSYDLSNAAGTASNQLALITGSYYDTNMLEFTTNYFHCYDVPLTDGSNVITFHAMDLAGNGSELTANIVYMPGTNPPVVALLWPEDGMHISGGSITLKGQVNDPTASVSVTVADAGGNTNHFSGRTGRDGIFWVENVVLNSGTNFLAVTVSNATGDATTNLTLLPGSVGLTVNPVSAGDTLVTGTIGTNDYTVWVNGNQTTNNGDGTWTVQITPLCVGGGQVAVVAIPNSDNGGGGSSGGGGGANPSSSQSINAQATVQPPQGVFISVYHNRLKVEYPPVIPNGPASQTGNTFMDWEDGAGGSFGSLVNTYYLPVGFHIKNDSVWPASFWPEALPEGTNTNIGWNDDGNPPTNNIHVTGTPYLLQEHCDVAWANNAQSGKRTADTEMRLATGGPLGSTRQNLWVISASATGYTDWPYEQGSPIPYDQIEIGSLGNLDTNGNLYVLLPDNDPVVVTPMIAGL